MVSIMIFFHYMVIAMAIPSKSITGSMSTLPLSVFHACMSHYNHLRYRILLIMTGEFIQIFFPWGRELMTPK